MGTTFTSDYQIKIIGTGLEAGTWGDSTSENLKRLEQALGTAVSIDVRNPPTGSTAAAADGSTAMEWLTPNTADADKDGSEGRAAFVEFKGVVSDDITVNIRGASLTAVPSRMYVVRNSLDSTHSLTLNGNDSGATRELVIKNGAYALVLVYASDTSGGLTQYSVLNALSKLQIDDLLFPEAGDITVAADTTSALDIKDSASTYLTLSTDVDVTATITGITRLRYDNKISGITKANPAVVSFSPSIATKFDDGDWVRLAGVDGMTEVNDRLYLVASSSTSSLILKGVDSTNYTTFSGTTNIISSSTAIVTVDAISTIANNDMVLLESVGGMSALDDEYYTVAGVAGNTFKLSGVDVSDTSVYSNYTSAGTVTKVVSELDAATGVIDVNTPVLDADTQATNIRIKDEIESSLQIREGSNPYIDIDTRSTGVIGLKNTVISSVTDGTEDPTTNVSYLNFGRISGEDGFGIRSNAGTIQTKSNSGEWGNTPPTPGSGNEFRTTRIDTTSTGWELAPEQTVGGDLLENGGFLDYYLGFNVTGTPTSGTTNVVVSSSTGMVDFLKVVGTGIDDGTVIAASGVVDGSNITISKDATGSAPTPTIVSTNGTSAPNGWTAAGTIKDIYNGRFASTTLTEGRGSILKVTPSGDETGVLSQTISNPIGSTDYLIEARIETTADAVVTLTTTGGSTNVSSVSDGAAAQTLRGIATTDSSGTNIVVKLASTAAEEDPYYVYYVQARRIATTSHMNRSSSGYAVTSTSTNGARFDSVIVADFSNVTLDALFGELATSIVATSSSKRIVVDALLQSSILDNGVYFYIYLWQSINGASAVKVNRVWKRGNKGADFSVGDVISVGYVCHNPIPGAVYTYTLTGYSNNTDATYLTFSGSAFTEQPPSHWMRVQLI